MILRAPRWAGPIAVVIVIGTVAACGDDDAAGSTADQSSIETLLIRHYKTPSCDDLTPAGRTAFGHPVDDTACAADIKHQAPKSVTVTGIKVDGDSAKAEADGYVFTLKRVSGSWRIDG